MPTATSSEQVLVNLLKNVAEAIGSGGRSSDASAAPPVGSRALSRTACSGVPDDAPDGLFTPFHSTKDGGQGLGLTLVQEFLAARRFQFRFENAPRGSPWCAA